VFNYTAIESEIAQVDNDMERFSLVLMPVHLERPTRLLMFRRMDYLLTHSMVQNPSWEANWFAASQEIPRMDYWIQFISQSILPSSGRSEFLVSNVRPVVWKWEKVRLQRLRNSQAMLDAEMKCWMLNFVE